MLADFEPVILEDAGNPLEERDFSNKLDQDDWGDDDDIFFKPEILQFNNTDPMKPLRIHPKVQFTIDETKTSGGSSSG